jgi:hypothetical protein
MKIKDCTPTAITLPVNYAVFSRRELLEFLRVMDDNRTEDMKMSDCIVVRGQLRKDSVGEKFQLSSGKASLAGQ